MGKQIYKISSQGYLILGEDLWLEPIINEDEVLEYILPAGYIDTPLPKDKDNNQLPFYRPRWTGERWIEDMSQEEIDRLNNPIPEINEIEELKQALVELTMFISGGGM